MQVRSRMAHIPSFRLSRVAWNDIDIELIFIDVGVLIVLEDCFHRVLYKLLD